MRFLPWSVSAALFVEPICLFVWTFRKKKVGLPIASSECMSPCLPVCSLTTSWCLHAFADVCSRGVWVSWVTTFGGCVACVCVCVCLFIRAWAATLGTRAGDHAFFRHSRIQKKKKVLLFYFIILIYYFSLKSPNPFPSLSCPGWRFFRGLAKSCNKAAGSGLRDALDKAMQETRKVSCRPLACNLRPLDSLHCLRHRPVGCKSGIGRDGNFQPHSLDPVFKFGYDEQLEMRTSVACRDGTIHRPYRVIATCNSCSDGGSSLSAAFLRRLQMRSSKDGHRWASRTEELQWLQRASRTCPTAARPRSLVRFTVSFLRSSLLRRGVPCCRS